MRKPETALVAAHPSEALRHAMKPTPFVLFLRTFFLYQLWRFAWVNLRMLTMIWRSHSSRPASGGSARPHG